MVPALTLRSVALIGLTAVALALLAWCSLWAFSSLAISQSDLWAGLSSPDANSTTGARIVHQIRLPRSAGAIFIGGALGLCGLLMQGITRNRLASPSILGVTAGASLALALVSSGVITLALPYANLAATVLGGAFAWILVFLLGTAWSMEASRGRLVLAGMTIAALCAGMTRLVVLLAEERALGVLNWLAGSLSNLRGTEAGILGIAFAAAIALSGLVANQLNLINLGAETAKALGAHLRAVRLAVFLGCCIITGATVAFAGPIGFVGLMAPNIARLLVGSDYRPLVPMTAAVGAILLLSSDILARAVAFPAETPAGAVTALIGAPFFLLLARKHR